jgi:hypothetical protein
MQKDVPIAVAAGVASAVMALAPLTGSMLAMLPSLFVVLPLLVVGILRGHRAAGIAGLTAAAVSGVFGAANALSFLLAFALPVWVAVRLTQAERPEQALASLVTFAAAALVAGCLTFMTPETTLHDQLAGVIVQMVEAMPADALPPEIASADRTAAALSVTAWLPGVMAAMWVVMVVVNAALAFALTRGDSSRAIRRPTVADIRLPDSLSWMLVAAAAAALALDGDYGYMARNLTVVFGLPFLVVGLAVVHALLRRSPFRRAALAVLYLFVIMFVWPKIVVAGLGMIDQWAGVRRRFAAPDDNDEETS